MEALLPSEIARLVLGYLEDQKCTEAAKLFLETSSHLQECRTVLSFGRRFSTRVSGLTLMDIVEKFSAISTMIQERLNRVTDCEQLKHCGDLIEQLKFLVEEPRGQRFVVNINVPSQNNAQASSNSPITASNMHKRRHSNSERLKRTIKPQSNTVQQIDVIKSPSSCHNIDTTPLESLPGNTDSLKQVELSNNISEKKDNNVTQELHSQCDYNKSDNTTVCNRSNSIRRSLDDIWSIRNCEMDVNDKRREENNATNTVLLKRCTTATNTEELLSFSSAEVQTTPYEIPESESESNDEPIENLSILTKEILNRTELQECIAENINRAIIPTDLSLREESFNDSVGGEGNTSIMAELNNAIKSIVEATETDPVFEKFLDEIIGPHTETDTSPEEDGEGKSSPKSLNEIQEKPAEVGLSNINSPEPMIADTRTSIENDIAEVPLKHRLRSSSRQQYNRTEDEIDKTRDHEKEQSVLENQNAAAVLSIINANIVNTSNDKKTIDDAKESTVTNDDNRQKIQTVTSIVNKNDALKPLTSTNIQKMNNIVSSISNAESKIKKSTVRRPKPTKPKRDQAINDRPPMVMQQDIITMPTLVLCSEEEMNNLLTINCSSTIRSTSASRFIPIAPKDENKIEKSVETVYLRAVNVAQKVPVARTLPAMIEEPNNPASQVLLQTQKKTAKTNKKLKPINKDDKTMSAMEQQVLHLVEPVEVSKIIGSESITLYGNESSAKTSLEGTNMPTINLEENISLSKSGFSPYLKFNCSKTGQTHNLSDIDLTPMIESAKNTMANDGNTDEQQSTISTKNTDCDIITKRTPRSLLKSRSKNSRLSLSTPRKRSTHIRALDFSTPPKVIGSTRRSNGNETVQFSSASTKRLKSICRTSLFKSPPFSNSSAMIAQKQKNPMKVCQSYKIPIATRSPAPKLKGGWDKYNGVGVIIGDVSPHGSTSASSSSDDRIQHKTFKTPAESWDADLRKSIQLNKKNEIETKKPAKRKISTRDKSGIICKRDKFDPRSMKRRDKRKDSETSKGHNQRIEDTNRVEENYQKNVKVATIEKNHHAVPITKPRNTDTENIAKVASNDFTNKSVKISELADSQGESPIRTSNINVQISTQNVLSNTADEKKPIKKYVQLKTIRTNLRNSSNENKNNIENVQTNSQVLQLSANVISTDGTQHILRIADMIDLDTPRKSDGNASGVPPTPRMLSPNNNANTPFMKLDEDSNRIRSFINTPEFPTTPCIALTPKLAEETTRDVVKRNDYNSPYYKPVSEQASEDPHKTSTSNLSTQESPVLSSSHMKLQSTHNSLVSSNTYQTCTSSKLEITQFEVIKENLPKEEAIKELKIASSSKDSGSATELNSPLVVVDRHVNVVQINEFNGVNKHCETIIDDNYDGGNDSSSSDISTNSSNSSSSSTSTTDTDSSTSNSSIDKCDPASKNINMYKDTNVVTENVQANMPNDACKRLGNTAIEAESSPKKMLAIAKTDEQIETTLKETPAKDENLLNEANISETPSGSKSGIENLTNLSTKISAIITEDEKLSKLHKSPKDSNKIVGRPRTKPKIVNEQYIGPKSLKIVAATKYAENKCQSEQQQSTSAHNELIVQLEEKRQRMIAKFRDIPKSNLSSGKAHKHILAGKTSDSRKKTTQFGRQQNVRSTPKYSYRTRVNRDYNKNAVPHVVTSQKNSQTVNTRKRCEQQKQSSMNERCGDDEKMKKHISSVDANPTLMNCGNSNNKVLDDSTTKQSHTSTICNTGINNTVESDNRESVQLHKISSSEDQHHSREKSDVKENVDNIARENTKETFRDNNTRIKILEQEARLAEKRINTQETLASNKTKQEIYDQAEDKVNKTRQFVNHADKSKCILKYKVDQIKRDLFSDEENDQRTFNVANAKNDEGKKAICAETQDSDRVEVPSMRENANVEDPKEELTVLQCLQLVPAQKNEHAHDDEKQTRKQRQEQNERKNINKAYNESNQIASIHNYKAEYHFIYDDSMPIRKRRRRYSAHDLQIEINYADLSDPNSVECTKIMKAIEFEEIFNLPPKSLSKKRTLTKKASNKNEKGWKIHNSKTDNDALNLKDATVKPLATSSPLDEPSGAKKKIIKTIATSVISNDTQFDKKKLKTDKPQEKDITAKNRKRKLSETKEIKQNEKKPCTTDPQTLLNNVDLDKFLSAVHGPNN